MKKKRTFKEKLAYTIERVEDSAKVSVLLLSIFLGIGLVIVTGLQVVYTDSFCRQKEMLPNML